MPQSPHALRPPVPAAVARAGALALALASALLMSSCGSGEDPIDPVVQKGNAALIRSEYVADTGGAAPPASVAASGTAAGSSAGSTATSAGATAVSAAASNADATGATDTTSDAAAAGADARRSDEAVAAFASEALEAINAARAQPRICGEKAYPAVGPLRWNARVAYAALLEVDWMQSTNSFGHIWPTGERVWDRLAIAGYAWSRADENIAAGFKSLPAAMKGWIDSPPHCVALMRADVTEVGVAVIPGSTQNTYLSYWAMVLATPVKRPAE